MHFDAAISMCGSSLLWIGCWNLAAAHLALGQKETSLSSHVAALGASSYRDVVHVLGSIVALVVCDTFHSSAGLHGSYLPLRFRRSRFLLFVRLSYMRPRAEGGGGACTLDLFYAAMRVCMYSI